MEIGGKFGHFENRQTFVLDNGAKFFSIFFSLQNRDDGACTEKKMKEKVRVEVENEGLPISNCDMVQKKFSTFCLIYGTSLRDCTPVS